MQYYKKSLQTKLVSNDEFNSFLLLNGRQDGGPMATVLWQNNKNKTDQPINYFTPDGTQSFSNLESKSYFLLSKL